MELLLVALFDAIRERKDIDGQVRFYLMDFMLNPTVYLDKLREAFSSCLYKTLELHHEKAQATLKWQESFKEETLHAFASRFYPKEVLEKNVNQTNEPVIFSMSLFVRNTIVSEIEKKTKWFILGIDYRRQAKQDKEMVVDMAALGNAFGDRHRLKIVRLLQRHGELSVSDLANRMGLAVNSVSYHLDIMRKANLLRSRSKGKSTIYWLNTQVCAIISETLKNWAKGGGGVEKPVEKTYGYHVNAGDDE